MPTCTHSIHFECRLCHASGTYPVFKAREMMYGTLESFDYVHCSSCGCLQICEIPDDLGLYYPADYYSQLASDEPAEATGLKGAVTRWFCRSSALRPASSLEAMLRSTLPVPTDFSMFGQYLVEARLQSQFDRILDVGCGSSPYRLAAFRRCGFIAVEGIDPFNSADAEYHGVPVYQRTIEQMEGVYGLIMFHHSLEHVPDPVTALRAAARLLCTGGTCLVRIPVMGTHFWRTFGVDWIELDAPRHLHLMAPRTVEVLAQATGFRLRKTEFDSQGWEIAGSRQYQANIPWRDARSVAQTGANTMFNAEDLRDFETQANELNRAADGGRACFYLEKL